MLLAQREEERFIRAVSRDGSSPKLGASRLSF